MLVLLQCLAAFGVWYLVNKKLDRIQQETPDCVESSLKVHVSNLRKKLREVGQKDYIEAVWGIGFKLREE